MFCSISHCSRPTPTERDGALCASHYHIQWSGRDPEGVVLQPIDVTECLESSCYRAAQSGGLCVGHRNAAKQGLIPIPEGSTVKLKPQCSFPGCVRMQNSKGLCQSHYYQQRQGEPLTEIVAYSVPVPCTALGCEIFTASASGMCKQHKNQLRTRGITWPIGQPRPIEPAICPVVDCLKVTNVDYPFCGPHTKRARVWGVTPQEMAQILFDASCEACGSKESLVMDHDHSCCGGGTKRRCGKCNRGILCNNCNTAYGMLNDSLERLVSLLEYANRTSAPSFMLAA